MTPTQSTQAIFFSLLVFALVWLVIWMAFASPASAQRSLLWSDQDTIYAPSPAPSRARSLGLEPLPILPPLGTSECTPVPTCDARGRNCAWLQVCR
jgi:hypothetical protein